MIKVFIIDDQVMVIDGVKLLLSMEADMDCIGHALSSEEALPMLYDNLPDVLLLDINLEGESGAHVCELLKQKFEDLNIIALSMHSELSLIRMMLRNGADGYVIKNAEAGVLAEAIRTVKNGDSFVWYKNQRQNKNDILKSRKERNKQIVFSKREQKILTLISQETAPQDIADQLDLSLSTLAFYQNNLLKKMKVNSVDDLKKHVQKE